VDDDAIECGDDRDRTHGNERQAGETLEHQSQRRRGASELLRRHCRHRDPYHQRVDERSQAEGEEQRPRQGAARLLDLFGDVDEMLEADEGKDRDERGSGYSGPGRRIAGSRPDFGKPRDDVGAVTETGDDDQHEAAHFDHRHDAGECDRLDGGKTCHRTHGEHDPGNDPRSGNGQKHRDITGAADADRRGRDRRRRNHEKPDGKAEPVAPEGRLHIGRFAGAHRHARAEFSK